MTKLGIDSVDVAIYDTAHEYKDPVTKQRGIPALAERMNMNEGTLQNKVNAALPDH